MKLAGALISGLLLTILAAPSVSSADYAIVAHPSVSGGQIRKADLAAIFLGRAKQWANHTPASPIDQSAQSEVRAELSREILGVPVAGALQYWSEAITDGLRPPTVRGSDADVLAFVGATEGAIGYVSSSAEIPPGVRVLEIVD